MSFQGSDVSGLDKTANTCMKGAQFAKTLATALQIIVAALEAMSWTGWAAAFAAYLKAVVIPWVKYIGQCLEMFGGLLQLASSKQKDASQDSPQVSIPASAWNPPPAPSAVRVDPPRLACPTPAITQSDPGTGAQTGGGTSVAPTPTIGRTIDSNGAAVTGGGSSTAPTPTIGRTIDSNGAAVTGGGTVTTVTGVTADGDLWTRTTVTGGGTAAAPSYVPTASEAGGLASSVGMRPVASIPQTAIDGCFDGGASLGAGSTPAAGGAGGSFGSAPGGSSFGGGGSVGGGGSFGSGSGIGSEGGGSGSGAGSGAGGGTGGGSGGGTGGGSGPATSSLGSGSHTSEGSPLASGNPASHVTPMQATGGSIAGTSSGSIDSPATPTSGGVAPAALAAPLGLAGVGTAALAALRAKGVKNDDEADEDDHL